MMPRTRARAPFHLVESLLAALLFCCRCGEATDRPIWAILSQPNRVSGESDTPAFGDMPSDWAFINAGTCWWLGMMTMMDERGGRLATPCRIEWGRSTNQSPQPPTIPTETQSDRPSITSIKCSRPPFKPTTET